MAKFRHRHLFALALFGIGLAMVIEGCRAQAGARTNLEDDVSWYVWSIGMSLTAAGVTMFFARLARPIVVIPIAIACPFVAFSILVSVYWGAVILGVGRWPSQTAMVYSGYQLIPEAKQIDDLFGPAWHFAANYQDPNIVEWFSEALFGGRYELRMVVKAEVDRDSGSIVRTTGKPRFFLHEVVNIEGRSIAYGRQYQLSADDWRKVVAAEGDFSVIGIPVDLTNPLPGFSEYQRWQRNGIQMTPDTIPTTAD